MRCVSEATPSTYTGGTVKYEIVPIYCCGLYRNFHITAAEGRAQQQQQEEEQVTERMMTDCWLFVGARA